MSKKKGTREVKLRTLTFNVSQADIARQCNVTAQTVSQAIKAERQIFLIVNDDNEIQKVLEYRDPVEIWNK